MSVDVRERLAELGLRLPEVSAPKGAYVPAVRSGIHVFVAGQIPLTGGELTLTGRVGAEVSPERARELSRQCALAALAAADSVAPLESVVRVVKVVGYVSSAPGFTRQAGVVDGASELLVEVFGEAGRHARSAVGMDILPLDAPVEIEVVLEVVPHQGAA
ncbi:MULTISPECIES: RidA family protein [Streptomyces]|uniref:RidA family protein n=1 Tax=Streptomyces TaxID=1883 RepID=UPI000F796303|nr:MULTISPECIES: RidA family protein [Streptomyces]RST07423.1 RidA family protein [Streptomyces sp. WAC07149]GLX18781.1 putative endoribonuclease [Streptomyces lavendulae subsp. lavendulae]GLX29296.1 putative endoribonuclease [Streptomyces lavendulae subsp. lavendulae]